jgi:hypothetical protein
LPAPLTTRDTVATETPVSLATSFAVAGLRFDSVNALFVISP